MQKERLYSTRFMSKTVLTYLHIWQWAECTEQSHSLATAGRATEHQRFVLGKPGVQQSLVTHSVNGWDNYVRRCYLVGLHFNLWNLWAPQNPLTLECNLHQKIMGQTVKKHKAQSNNNFKNWIRRFWKKTEIKGLLEPAHVMENNWLNHTYFQMF